MNFKTTRSTETDTCCFTTCNFRVHRGLIFFLLEVVQTSSDPVVVLRRTGVRGILFWFEANEVSRVTSFGLDIN